MVFGGLLHAQGSGLLGGPGLVRLMQGTPTLMRGARANLGCSSPGLPLETSLIANSRESFVGKERREGTWVCGAPGKLIFAGAGISHQGLTPASHSPSQWDGERFGRVEVRKPVGGDRQLSRKSKLRHELPTSPGVQPSPGQQGLGMQTPPPQSVPSPVPPLSTC